jgi:hypothetical protein
MPDRFWVGGNSSWDGTAGTKWALTSGGAGGQSVPTSADDVFFDGASGAVTCTIASGNTGAKSINCTGFTGTLTHGAANISVAGSVTLVAGMTFNPSTSFFIFTANSTLTTSGKVFAAVQLNTAGVTLTLGDALNTGTRVLDIRSGTFNTANYNVTAQTLNAQASTARTITLGSSTVTLVTGLSFETPTTLTFNAGTSQINITSTSGQVNVSSGGSIAFNNVAFTSVFGLTHSINGTNTFNNLTVTGPSSAGVVNVNFDSRTTINGTLSTTGTAGNRRVWFRGTTYGIAQTLTINSAPSLTDADFRDIYVIGTAAPISGTRIGNLRGCRGITFTSKTVYWNLAAGGNWSANAWAATSGGGVSTDNFPLAQDTAVIENTGLNTSATVTLDAAVPYIGTLTTSTRSNAMSLASATTTTFYGNFTLSSAVTPNTGFVYVFSGRNTQTITSAGKTLNQINVDSYGGSVELADALNVSAANLNVVNGTFDTKNFNVTAGELASSNSNVRTISLGSSTVTLISTATFTTSTNLTFNAGTSSIVCTSGAATFEGGGQIFYDVSFTSPGTITHTINQSNTFNNLSITAPSSAGLRQISVGANQTINGTLTVAGATAVRRIFVRSSLLGTPRTLTVNSLSATDCDFRDITIAGTAAGSSPTRAGNCGGSTGITFPAPKTVYWNLAGTQVWSATAWATGSGGTPDINQFPLAQDTAVFNDAGSAGTIQFQTFNIGTIDASARTSAITLSYNATSSIYGNYTLGSGVTTTNGNGHTFSSRGTQTITSAGKTLSFSPIIDCVTGTVQLADALVIDSARTLTLTSGTFDAVTYNVTTGLASITGSTARTLRMGSGTWTLSGTGIIWNASGITNLVFFKGTANIVLSDTSITARAFAAGGLSYNKLTIGGTTGTSTTSITDNNQFTELASTKTVAHTIDLGSTIQTFGAWTVTGTAGNVVTVTGTGTLTIAGARVSGVDYLALGTTSISTTSPGEFYAGANSTGGTRFILTAAPAAVTRYWRGGTGTWDATTTTNWSASSGGAGGASVPTSADAVIFDSASNATAYTVTCTATQLRCGSLTMAGPLSGNVTWAGSAPIAMHDNVSLAATGITRTYTGTITLSGSTTGRTFTTNGVTLFSIVNIDGVGCGWLLGSALNNGGNTFGLVNGSFDTASYAVTFSQIFTANANTRSLVLGSSTVTISGASGLTASTDINLTINAGTSTILMTAGGQIFTVNPTTFYNVTWNTTLTNINIYGVNTFNNVTFSGGTTSSINRIFIRGGPQTINGTLTFSAGTNATMRLFVQSEILGTPRTLTCAAFSGTDVDFRDITIAGAAAPVSGTRLGDCKGNSGITFDAAKTVWWRAGGGADWGSNSWSATNGGALDVTQFPLAQDTAVFPSSPTPYPSSGQSITFNASYNIGTIDMSARTTNTMTLATSQNMPIYGNWINGTGITLSGLPTLTFAGRGSQTITSAGRTFTQQFTIDCRSGSVTLQDAFNSSNANGNALRIDSGTFSANGYNVTMSGSTSGVNTGATTTPKISDIGSGTWTIAGSNGWAANATTTITGTGTISLTNASAKTFAGGGVSYSGITLNQGGAGQLTITGNNTFANISNTFKATGATTIAMGTTTQRVGNFTASGEAGRVLTVTGTSASSPATLILTSGTVTTPDYLTVTGVRAYNLTDTWYAGANSTNNGSLGWVFAAGVVAAGYLGNFFAFF